MPVLVDGDLIIPESRAAMAYLVNQYAPGHKLYPTDPKIRAQIDSYLFFDTSTIVPAARDVHRPIIRGERDKPSDEALKAYREKVALVDGYLAGKKFLVGDNKTLADLSMYAMLGMATMVDFDFSEFKNVKAWMDRLRAEMPYDDEINKKPVDQMKQMLKDRKAGK